MHTMEGSGETHAGTAQYLISIELTSQLTGLASALGRTKKKQKYTPTTFMKRCYANKVLIYGNAGNLNLNVPICYINGVSDAETIAENFAAHFANTCTSNAAIQLPTD